MTDTNDLPETVPEALERGWQPHPRGGGLEDEFDPPDYAWATIPCPACEAPNLIGVHDPDEELAGGSEPPMASLGQPPGERPRDQPIIEFLSKMLMYAPEAEPANDGRRSLIHGICMAMARDDQFDVELYQRAEEIAYDLEVPD